MRIRINYDASGGSSSNGQFIAEYFGGKEDKRASQLHKLEPLLILDF